MLLRVVAAAFLLAVPVLAAAPQQSASGPVQRIDLAAALKEKRLRVENREVTPGQDRAGAIHVSEQTNPAVVWILGTDFAEGTIEIDVRGRDMAQRSFLGVAFHGKDDSTLEGVYLRPFNFRATNPLNHQHAVQYISLPTYDWPRLRQEFPEEFENPVDASVVPTGWVPLRVVVKGRTVQIFVGTGSAAALEVRKLGDLDRGMIGLWVGNMSDGDFANLRITPAK